MSIFSSFCADTFANDKEKCEARAEPVHDIRRSLLRDPLQYLQHSFLHRTHAVGAALGHALRNNRPTKGAATRNLVT